MTPISKRQRARCYLYKKQEIRNVYIYIYKNPDTLQKSKTIFVTFLFTEIKTLYITKHFMIVFNWYLYIKKV